MKQKNVVVVCFFFKPKKAQASKFTAHYFLIRFVYLMIQSGNWVPVLTEVGDG